MLNNMIVELHENLWVKNCKLWIITNCTILKIFFLIILKRIIFCIWFYTFTFLTVIKVFMNYIILELYHVKLHLKKKFTVVYWFRYDKIFSKKLLTMYKLKNYQKKQNLFNYFQYNHHIYMIHYMNNKAYIIYNI